MKLSSLKEGRAGKFLRNFQNVDFDIPAGTRFIVTDRVPADRSSGLTTIRTEAGLVCQMIWDHDDPTVMDIGKGCVDIKVFFAEDKKPPLKPLVVACKHGLFVMTKIDKKVIKEVFELFDYTEYPQHDERLKWLLDEHFKPLPRQKLHEIKCDPGEAVVIMMQ